jgi:hypothetical protein
MENVTISMNQEEINTLIALLDVANKTEGLKVAEACIHFQKKIEESVKSFNDANPVEETVAEEA